MRVHFLENTPPLLLCQPLIAAPSARIHQKEAAVRLSFAVELVSCQPKSKRSATVHYCGCSVQVSRRLEFQC